MTTRQKFISHSHSSLSPSCLGWHTVPEGQGARFLLACCSTAFDPWLPAHGWLSSMWRHPSLQEEGEEEQRRSSSFQRPDLEDASAPPPHSCRWERGHTCLQKRPEIWSSPRPSWSQQRNEEWILGQPVIPAQRTFALNYVRALRANRLQHTRVCV